MTSSTTRRTARRAATPRRRRAAYSARWSSSTGRRTRGPAGRNRPPPRSTATPAVPTSPTSRTSSSWRPPAGCTPASAPPAPDHGPIPGHRSRPGRDVRADRTRAGARLSRVARAQFRAGGDRHRVAVHRLDRQRRLAQAVLDGRARRNRSCPADRPRLRAPRGATDGGRAAALRGRGHHRTLRTARGPRGVPQRPHASLPSGPDRWSGSEHRRGLRELDAAPHVRRHRRHRRGVDTVPALHGLRTGGDGSLRGLDGGAPGRCPAEPGEHVHVGRSRGAQCPGGAAHRTDDHPDRAQRHRHPPLHLRPGRGAPGRDAAQSGGQGGDRVTPTVRGPSDLRGPAVDEAEPGPAPGRERGPLLTPRRSNIILVLLAAVLLPTLTYRAMPLLPAGVPQALAIAASIAVGAISLNLLIGYAGQISLGHGALLAVGAFAAGLCTSGAGLPMWIGLPVAAVVSALIALVVGFPALRLRGLYLAIVTITFGYAMYNSVLLWSVFTGGSGGVTMVRRLFGAVTIPSEADMLAAALVVLVLAWLLDSNVTRTKLGRAFRAIRESEAVAGSFGVDVARYKLLAFVLSGGLAGLAGALFGFCVYSVNSETFNPPAGLEYSLLLIIIVVVGGLGSRAGAVVAAFVFSTFQYLMGTLFGTSSFVYGIAPILGSVMLMYTVARPPGGFAGALAELRERRSRRAVLADDEEPPMPALPSMPRPAGLPQALTHDTTVPVLEVEGVTMRFGGLLAVDSASLRVTRGQIVGLIGPNGAGKTTLFNCISGLLRPDSGTVRMGGQDISALPAHKRARLGLARTFQQIGLAKDQTVLGNMLLAQHVRAGYGRTSALAYTARVARSEDEMRQRALTAITALGFAGREKAPVRLLSGGQQRIVEVACALLTDPELLMLDEPSAGMSPAAGESLADRLRDLRDRQGRTVLLIEHNVPLVLDVCDYVYVLNFGRILAEGTPDEILAHPEVITAYLGEAVA